MPDHTISVNAGPAVLQSHEAIAVTKERDTTSLLGAWGISADDAVKSDYQAFRDFIEQSQHAVNQVPTEKQAAYVESFYRALWVGHAQSKKIRVP